MYDAKEIYLNQIQPLIIQIKEICSTNQIPMFFAVATADDGEKTDYEFECIMASTEKKLADNHIASALFTINQFDLEYPKNVKDAIMVLEHFIDRTKNLEETGVPLSEDYFSDFNEIKNGAKAVLPKRFLPNISEDEDEFVEYKG